MAQMTSELQLLTGYRTPAEIRHMGAGWLTAWLARREVRMAACENHSSWLVGDLAQQILDLDKRRLPMPASLPCPATQDASKTGNRHRPNTLLPLPRGRVDVLWAMLSDRHLFSRRRLPGHADLRIRYREGGRGGSPQEC
ncbi:hypothetical protein GCM10010339_85030 [Streptomyces alanosinicus]|uniref:Uncharacterized protein n=1 Tax=Streptomyces alanosinicus TaxID=68171 RepID=A0A919D8Z2_9ACTN|nr:hypothetical protein GCM10010339_85030 [Streptomyces alanosinicus]